MNLPQAAPIDSRATTRRSSDSVWPLRDAQGLTWAERKARDTELTPRRSPRPPSARGENRNSSTARAPTGDNPVGGE